MARTTRFVAGRRLAVLSIAFAWACAHETTTTREVVVRTPAPAPAPAPTTPVERTAPPLATTSAPVPAPGTAEEIAALEEVAKRAYVYAYPLVLMDLTRELMTATPRANGFHAPMNQFAHADRLVTPEFRDFVRPSRDTLYSSAWLDLRAQPMVLDVPATTGRFFVLEVLDAYTNVVAAPGTRTLSAGAHRFALVGPDFRGTIPRGVERLDVPTNMVWILGRTQVNGPSDVAAARRVSTKFKLTPLESYGLGYVPPTNVPVDPRAVTNVDPMRRVETMPPVEYYQRFAELLKTNPPASADFEAITSMAAIGIRPGQSLDVDALTPAQRTAMTRGAPAGLQQITSHRTRVTHLRNGWTVIGGTLVGAFGTNYDARALVAMTALGANMAADAMYATAELDGRGVRLDGSRRYVLHFDADKLPPSRAFWSLTTYDERGYLVDNPEDRYSIGDRDAIQRNPDGSIDVYVQTTSPGTGREANWLPVPYGRFSIMLRVYWPTQEMLSGGWSAPPIRRVE